MTTENPAPKGPPLTKVRRAGNLLFVSGQLPRGQDGAIVPGDIVVQTRQSIANLQAALATAGATLEHVVKVTAWLTDVNYLDGFNQAYREAFAEPYPARSTVISGLAAGDVEIEAIAWLP
jgi:2-iminobutanoate/2-iminopropanoate deaminase